MQCRVYGQRHVRHRLQTLYLRVNLSAVQEQEEYHEQPRLLCAQLAGLLRRAVFDPGGCCLDHRISQYELYPDYATLITGPVGTPDWWCSV